MILGFKEQFKRLILSGYKVHTLRNNDRIRPGVKLHMATGVRTKLYNCFCEKECISTQRIKFTISENRVSHYCIDIYCSDAKLRHIDFMVDGRSLEYGDAIKLIMNDGFTTFFEFIEFFCPKFSFEPFVFDGNIIHWTDLKY
jgi:hypothetical protein